MGGAMRALAALLVVLLAAPTAALPAEEGLRRWRSQRRVRSLEAGDALGTRLFTAYHRSLARRRQRQREAQPPAAADVGTWLSRYGEVRAEPRPDPPALP